MGSRIFRIHHLIYLTLVVVTQGHLFKISYKEAEIGQTLTGTLGGKYVERWQIYCSWRYLNHY